jgi:hypothetical protein
VTVGEAHDTVESELGSECTMAHFGTTRTYATTSGFIEVCEEVNMDSLILALEQSIILTCVWDILSDRKSRATLRASSQISESAP